MDINMSNLDRMLRFFGAIIIIALYYTGTVIGSLGIIGLVLAIVLLGTAIFGNCPLYTLLGIRTCPNKS